MPHPLLGKSILLITAHPDDEAFLAGGLAYVNTRRGGTTSLICATHGEQGTSHLNRPVTPTQLKTIRRRELINCCHLKGIWNILLLHYPDGRLKQHLADFRKRVEAFIKTLRPDVLVTFGPDGITGHEDHITCWRVGRRVAREHKLPLFMFTVAPTLRKPMARWVERRRAFGKYVRHMHPYALATVRVATPPGVKMKILRNHPSQFEPDNPYAGYPSHAVSIFTRAEYFAEAAVSKHRRTRSAR